MRYLRLSEEEKTELELLRKNSPNSVVRERSFMLLLSNNGMCVNEIALLFNHTRHTISRMFNTWEKSTGAVKFEVLSIAKGRGPKVRLKAVADLLPDLVEQHSRNLKPVLEILEKQHGIKVTKPTLQSFLKGAGLSLETGSTVVEEQARPESI